MPFKEGITCKWGVEVAHVEPSPPASYTAPAIVLGKSSDDGFDLLDAHCNSYKYGTLLLNWSVQGVLYDFLSRLRRGSEGFSRAPYG